MPAKLSQDIFLNRSKKIHSCRYNYSKVSYKNKDTKVEIICLDHGSFWQAAGNHMNGQGCPKCAIYRKKKLFQLGKDEFIRRSVEIHGNKYSYDMVSYINTLRKVEIICPNHGSFWQKPNGHLNGHGCRKCADEVPSVILLDYSIILKRLKKTHGNKYNYSKVQYKNTRTKVEIVCPVHGSFWQTMGVHMMGHGCPGCSDHGFKKDRPAFLYYLQDLETGLYKIGITNNTPIKRFGKRKKIKLVQTWLFQMGKDAADIEKKILTENSAHRVRNENFTEVGGATEFFNRDILKIIEQQIEK